MSTKNLFMLFGPKFDGFGCDVARAFTARCNGGRVHGLFTGPREIREHVADELGDIGGQFWWLEEEEEAWLSTPALTDELRRLEQDLGPGAFGRIVTADRRAGRGFVRGGLLRPNRIGHRIARDPAPAAQRYVHGLYRFLVTALSETETDVVFCYAVAGAPAMMLAELCGAQGIPFCRLTNTRMDVGFVVDDDAAGRLSPVARRFERARDGHAPFAPSVLAAAHERLKAYRAAPVPPEYSGGNRNQSRPRTVSLVAMTARTASSLFFTS